MHNMIWLIIMLPCSALFSGIGIYALRRKKPMWFWSGSEVSEYAISDVPAYNRANGIMWLAFSAVFRVSAILGYLQIRAGAVLLITGCVIGIPVLPIIYGKIYSKYKQ